MTYRPIPELPEFTKADAHVYRLFGAEEALAIRRLADEMTLRHNEHHPVIRYAMAETAVLSMISYEPCTHGELMHAARLVSLSMLQTDLAHEAAQPTATVEQKVRLAAEVMRLERTICQSEKHFIQRQAVRRADQPPRSPAATPAARAGNQMSASTVARDPAAEAPATAPAPAAAPTFAAVSAAAPASAVPVPAAASAAAPTRAAPNSAAASAAAPTRAAPNSAAASAAAPTPAASAPAAQSAVASATAATPPAAAASPARPSPGAAALATPARAPHPPAAGAPRTAVAAHPRTASAGPPSPRTGALLDLDDPPPDGVSAAVRDELARAIARGMATGGAAQPPSLGFGHAPRP